MTYTDQYLSAVAASLASTEVSTRSGEKLAVQEGLDQLCALCRDLKESGSALWFIGNGASAAMASHMTVDWTKNVGLRSMALNDAALLTACANDNGIESVFATPLGTLFREGDALVTISSSGGSPNIISAIEVARQEGAKAVVTFSGLKSSNLSRSLGDWNIYVPCKTYGAAECAHQVLLHMWYDCFLGVEEWDRETLQDMSAENYTL